MRGLVAFSQVLKWKSCISATLSQPDAHGRVEIQKSLGSGGTGTRLAEVDRAGHVCTSHSRVWTRCKGCGFVCMCM